MAHFEHVFVIVEENENYDEVIGNTKDMPYLNGLAAKYSVATNYYANTHPSINNYFYLTAGRSGTRSPWVGHLADKFPGEVAGDNIASVLTANGKTWKSYAESIPGAGYLGPDHFPYVKRHNPFAYFESVRQGKVFDIEIEGSDRAGAEAALKTAAEKLLANTVIENYRVEVMG